MNIQRNIHDEVNLHVHCLQCKIYLQRFVGECPNKSFEFALILNSSAKRRCYTCEGTKYGEWCSWCER